MYMQCMHACIHSHTLAHTHTHTTVRNFATSLFVSDCANNLLKSSTTGITKDDASHLTSSVIHNVHSLKWTGIEGATKEVKVISNGKAAQKGIIIACNFYQPSLVKLSSPKIGLGMCIFVCLHVHVIVVVTIIIIGLLRYSMYCRLLHYA